MCPSLHIRLTKTPTRHKATTKKNILSRGGCTYGDQPAMLMYGIAIKPLILKLQTPRTVERGTLTKARQLQGALQQLQKLFESLSNQGDSFGYHFKAPKCQMIAKPWTKKRPKIFLQTPKYKFSKVLEFSDPLSAVKWKCGRF